MLTDFFLNSGYTFFASGWTQFACGFGLAFMIMLGLGRPFVRAMHAVYADGKSNRVGCAVGVDNVCNIGLC